MRRPCPVFLLTDFGPRDSFAGQMRAVIEREAPGTPIHDLTHEIEPFAIDEAAWTLIEVLPHLPDACVVLVVVDPGVGTDRRALVVREGKRMLVAPDNGVFAGLAHAEGALREGVEARSLVPGRDGTPSPASNTFHGRDLFAVVAGRLAGGRMRFRDLGPKTPFVQPLSRAVRSHQLDGFASGYIVHIDRFGNAISTIVAGAVPADATVSVGGKPVPGPVPTFADIPPGTVAWYRDSSGLIAFAANQDSAARLLAIHRGNPVIVEGK